MQPTPPTLDSLYRQLCKNSDAGIWVLDTGHRITHVNENLAAMLQVEPEAVIGRSALDFVAPDEHARLLASWERRTGTRGEDRPLRCQRADGREVWLLINSTALVDDQGVAYGQFAVVTDTTEQVLAERYLEERAEAAHSLFNNNPDPIYILSCEGYFKDINLAAEALSGYSRQELLGKSWPPLVAPEDLESCTLAFERARGGAPAHYQATMIHRDGHRIPISGTSFPLIVRGQIRGVYGVVKDISALKRVEASLQFLSDASVALARSLDYRETLQLTAHLAVPMLGSWCVVTVREENGNRYAAQRCIDEAKDALVRQLCEAPLDLCTTGGPLVEFVELGETRLLAHDEDAELLAQIAPGEGQREQLRELAPQGLLCAPLRDHGRMRGFLLAAPGEGGTGCAIEDLRLAKDLAHRAAMALDNAFLHAALQRIDRNKDEFLAILGHELRNPLAAISSAVEVLLRAGLTDRKAQRALDTINRQTRQETRLIEDLLNVSRIAEGKLLLRIEPTDLNQVILAVLEDNEAALTAAGLQVERDVPATPLWIQADAARLAQVVTNLLHNSMKFTDRGGKVTVRVRPYPEEGRVSVEVHDTGIGIEPALVPHLFEPFTQVESSRSRSRHGLGLGLSLVKGLVELHGGAVHAASEGPGKGSVFWFDLPMAGVGKVPEAPVAAHPVLRSGAPLRVLVIEDDTAAADTMRDLLELMGYEAEVTYAGPEGVQAARALHPQVILCDIDLPGMNGFEVARVLRQEPALPRVSLVAITGASGEGCRIRAHGAGFDHCLLKPIDPTELQRLIEAAGQAVAAA